MDLARVKYCLDYIDCSPESLTHCNGVDMAYFIPDDVRGLIAEVEGCRAKGARYYMTEMFIPIERFRAEVDRLQGENKRLCNRAIKLETEEALWLPQYQGLRADLARAESQLAAEYQRGVEDAVKVCRWSIFTDDVQLRNRMALEIHALAPAPAAEHMEDKYERTI